MPFIHSLASFIRSTRKSLTDCDRPSHIWIKIQRGKISLCSLLPSLIPTNVFICVLYASIQTILRQVLTFSRLSLSFYDFLRTMDPKIWHLLTCLSALLNWVKTIPVDDLASCIAGIQDPKCHRSLMVKEKTCQTKFESRTWWVPRNMSIVIQVSLTFFLWCECLHLQTIIIAILVQMMIVSPITEMWNLIRYDHNFPMV